MDSKIQQEPPQVALTFWQHGLIFLLASAVIMSRRPDAILHAQFWAEDGHVFFAEAYNFGWWSALFRSYQGYLHVFPRLGASLALLIPLSLAPLLLNSIAICVQALSASLMLSSRSAAWGNLSFRSLFAGVYLALPDGWESIHGINQAQWHLAMSAFLVVAASIPRSTAARFFDASILLLFGLTGPFCIFLTPIALFLAWRRGERWRWTAAAILALGCFAQVWRLASGGFAARSHYALGASPTMFARLLGGHVYLDSLLGVSGVAALHTPEILVFLNVVAILGTAVIAVCLVESVQEMKLFLLFSSLIFAASLTAPATYLPPGVCTWDVLLGAPGSRYWFFPSIAFTWSLLWCLRSRVLTVKFLAASLSLLMCYGIIRSWKVPPYEDMHLAEYVSRFETAPPGTAVVFPENPEGWNMLLIKHELSR